MPVKASTYLAEPFAYFFIIYVVIIDPVFVASIVGRVYVDALYLAFVVVQESFECFEVIAMNDFVQTCQVGCSEFHKKTLIFVARTKQKQRVLCSPKTSTLQR